MPTIRVAMIDDHPLFRSGVSELLAADGGFELVGEAGTGVSGIELVRQSLPDLILLDMNMKQMNGIEVLRELQPAKNSYICVMLTMSNCERDIFDSIAEGAAGYLLKDMEPEALVLQLKRAAAGEQVLSDELQRLLNNTSASAELSTPTKLQSAELTPRELEIMRHIANGMSNKLIAKQLNICDSTVKAHLRNLMTKLELTSRLEVAIFMLAMAQESA